MITIKTSGSFHNTERFLTEMSKKEYLQALEHAADEGVNALSEATPQRSGLTANSWYQEVKHNRRSAAITWFNSNKNPHGTPIPILIEFGHGTREGGYVQAYEFINRTLEPLYDRLANDVWKAVTSA